VTLGAPHPSYGPRPLPVTRRYGFVTFADRASADAVKTIRQADFMSRTMNFGDAVQGGLGKARVAPPGTVAGPGQPPMMGRSGALGVPGGLPMGYATPWPGGAGMQGQGASWPKQIATLLSLHLPPPSDLAHSDFLHPSLPREQDSVAFPQGSR
jgi:hypothetical protein